MNKQPSLIKIITIDYAAFVAFLSPLVLWGLYIVLVAMQKADLNNFSLPIIFAAITITAIGVLVWRVRVINTIFSDCIELPATISNISFFRDRGRVDYIYTFQGQKYASGNAVHKVKQTQSYRIGEQVVVVVDSNHPKRAYIQDLYI